MSESIFLDDVEHFILFGLMFFLSALSISERLNISMTDETINNVHNIFHQVLRHLTIIQWYSNFEIVFIGLGSDGRISYACIMLHFA